MRNLEWVRFIVGGLRRQKGRTALTLIGIVVGAGTLAFSLSLAIGLRAMITREFESRASFWEVHVSPKANPDLVPVAEIPPDRIEVPESITGERRERLRQAKIEQFQAERPRKPPTPITSEVIRQFAAIPDVQSVESSYAERGAVRVRDKKVDLMLSTTNWKTAQLSEYLVAGVIPSDNTSDDVLVRETALVRLGFESDADFAQALGQPVSITLGYKASTSSLPAMSALGLGMLDPSQAQEKLLQKLSLELPKALEATNLSTDEKSVLQTMLAMRGKVKIEPPRGPETVTRTFRIAGILRKPTAEEFRKASSRRFGFFNTPDIHMPLNSGQAMFEEFPEIRERGLYYVDLQCKPGGDMRAVVNEVERMGFQQYSALEWYDSVMMEVTMIGGGLNLFAIISIFVAGLGITNTLATSVVERTREIGILKAIGATRGQILKLFLFEGTAIGLLGGLLGVLAAYTLTWPGDRLVSEMVRSQSQGRLNATTIFEFPLWLPLTTIGFTVLATTCAAYFPARRAAKMVPVEALRAI
jgi:putative ABC transport system permease protein